ncbi:putative feruloyl esterase [Helianthus annuus]|nr:putative feruloyl esterase [Helianthus annuus]
MAVANLQFFYRPHLHCHLLSPSSPPLYIKFPFSRNPNFPVKLRLSHGSCSIKVCFATQSTTHEEIQRPPFDINQAVVLAGFAFEAYTTPPNDNTGKTEVDAAGCQTLILSQSFLREIYDGQLFVKLNKGYDFPAMDPWGTSDPYVVLQLDTQIVKSKVKWGTKEPTWNEELTLYIKHPPTCNLQVAAWDANLVTPHKRMGNSSVSLESLCDGNPHEVLVELEGMGGGGKVQLEVKYKSFDTIEEEKNWWRLPFVAEFLRNNGFESTLKKVIGSEPVQARQFVEYAFGQLKSINEAHSQHNESSNGDNYNLEDSTNSNSQSDIIEQTESESTQSDKDFWKNFGNTINQSIVNKLGLPAPENINWDGFDLLSKIGIHSQTVAEAGYVESGLATPSSKNADATENSAIVNIQSSFPDIKRATQDLLKQTDSILGALMVLNATVTELTKAKNDTKGEENVPEGSFDIPVLDEKKAEEMRALFSTAESAMEAWAMLATSLGHPSFIKSEFEKICFLDNPVTDTQVAIWRDSARNRLVVAFRGTEQVKWKDLRTDLMLVPAGLNPERIGGDFKEEVQVHSGFLGAYDSVRTRIISLIKAAIGYQEDADQVSKWHVYVTGHSLGGALATLLALELSSSQLAKCGAISVTMYNFGSPRVGNKKFADVYNQKVKDSWRVVNHRDIIPSVPRLMGYCHVAQPIYLSAGDVQNAMENIELLGDGYEGDVIGESTPDALVTEFMKGETELIEKILNTEINIFRSIRDGSALMQHMEDFYYVSLLEHVRSNYRSARKTKSVDADSLSVKEA